jgi:tRNA (adenine58-N1)-methyltransferase non-catalytic subunit
VVVYSPTIDPLVELVDFYSTARRTAYIATKREWEEQQSHQSPVEARASQTERESLFPVDPTLLLGPSLQTSRVRPWQVLPGRTHPLMTGRGGAEGYVFHATRVLPSSDRITARGNSTRKRRKINETDTGPGTGTSTPVG